MTRLSLEYFEPKVVPPEVANYKSPLKQLPVGSPGKLGGLKLKLSRENSNKTILKSVWRRIPLQTLRPFYYDEAQPNLAIIYVLNPTGGTLQGDRLRMDIALEDGCKTHLTTQAATKIYRMNADYATQTINFTLGRNSYLEYLPDQTIPYRNSRFYQEVNVRMQSGSALMYWEILTAGRKGRERYDFDIFYSKVNVLNQNEEPLMTDTMMLEPKSSSLTRLGVMKNQDTLANFYLISERASETLVSRVHSHMTEEEDLMVGVSSTSLTRGLVARIVGPSTRRVKTVLEKIWNETRLEILGSPAFRIRK